MKGLEYKHEALDQRFLLGENLHPGNQKRKKEKEPVPLIQMLFFGKYWPKVATLWGVFF
jgi:hypothetical protein